MAVHTGLLQRLDPTDDELAQVMGHEISHALARAAEDGVLRGRARAAELHDPALGPFGPARAGIGFAPQARAFWSRRFSR
jgi:hypothetical protein